MIEVTEISKSFRRKKVLDSISFKLNRGEITALLGINGVGKSTTLKIIMGLIKQDSGSVLIDGEELTYKNLDKLSFVPDVKNIFKGMKIIESFEYMECFYDKWDSKKAHEMLEKFELNKEDKIDRLSKGNLAKVKIILGFAQGAEYILMDEPFSGIDIFTREDILECLINYINENKGILITTHEISEIEGVADRVILLNEGDIKEDFYVEDMKYSEGVSLIDKMREVFLDE
ncbi:ABC transporter ATP-binding protein [Clostridium sp. LIBA-8841]|uniref:ABC transporter ATP-binding protein n=1 Tax=Clostridium sp. LIBA-8841 TaxID=2987530 RepID=UPI002AC65EA1|nr:ABC transporter ATP-binding protein [Clostridium sp. LIBA-8841]MDZ5252981.1 ABC transporter ATP-binding protein [Clostridium sp. LIBA-8841]